MGQVDETDAIVPITGVPGHVCLDVLGRIGRIFGAPGQPGVDHPSTGDLGKQWTHSARLRWCRWASAAYPSDNYVGVVDRKLLEIMPPPQNSVPFPLPTWQAVEARYRELPADFKEFCDVYGPGAVCGEMTILHPLPSGDLWLIRDVLEDAALVAEHFPKDYPFPLFPSEGSLLPWAVDTNRGVYTWETLGPPSTWHVVVTTGGSPIVRTTDSMQVFIRRLLLHEHPDVGFGPSIRSHVFFEEASTRYE